MAKVLQDLEVGPKANAPGNPPSSVSPLTLQQESQMLIVLEDLSFKDLNGKIPSTLFMSAEKASASVFFQDLEATYDALGALDTSYLKTTLISSPSGPSDAHHQIPMTTTWSWLEIIF